MNSSTKKIGDFIFSIDDDANLILEDYLQKLQNHFSKDAEGGFKIFTIKQDLGNLFNEVINNGANTISVNDTKIAIDKIGSLESFGVTSENFSGQTKFDNERSESFANRPKKLFRTVNDKVIGGVCGGIAAYFNVDPIFIRVAALLACFGGVGIILYIVGIVVLPKSFDISFSGKRLYKIKEGKVIDGVCNGIGHYFSIPTLYVRLAFALPILVHVLTESLHINSGPNFLGLSVILYLVLVVIMPKYNSYFNPTNTANNYGNSNSANTYSQIENGNIADLIGTLFKTFGLFILGAIAFTFAMAFFGVFMAGVNFIPFSDYLFKQDSQMFLAQSGWILTFMIPIIWLSVYFYFRISGKQRPPYLNLMCSAGLLIGIISMVYLLGSLAKDFKISNERTILDSIMSISSANELVLKLNNEKGRYLQHDWMQNDLVELYTDSLRVKNVVINYLPSADNFFRIKTSVSAYGNNIKDVDTRINSLNFPVQLNDSILNIPQGFVLRKGNVWRGQQVHINIYIPEGKRIYLPEGLYDEIHNISFKRRSNYSFNINSNNDVEDGRWYTMVNGSMVNNDQTNTDDENDEEDEDAEENEANDENIEDDDEGKEVKKEIKEVIKNFEEELKQAKSELDEAKSDVSNLNENDTKNAERSIEKAQQKIDELINKIDSKTKELIEKNNTSSKIKKLESSTSKLDKKLEEAKQKLLQLEAPKIDSTK
jgi:phage shock protein PspC (stress-responsive transcriptional regulator)